MYKGLGVWLWTVRAALLWGAQVLVRRFSMGAQVRRGPFGNADPPQQDGPAGPLLLLTLAAPAGTLRAASPFAAHG